jgi:broad specificity phosphatase PhoE
MSVIAYFIRHGVTDKSPASEGWSQISLNELGKSQARSAALFIAEQKVKPTFAVSSDLARAVETCEIAAKILDIKVVKPLQGLRAFGVDEKQEVFEKRNEEAFDAVLKAAKEKKAIPLIVAHRSNSAWMGKHFSGVQQEMDYREASLVWEAGVVIIEENAAVPIYRALTENPRANLIPHDGTSISGFVTAEVNKPPRECGNCKWFQGSDGHCDNPVVTADDEIGYFFNLKRNKGGEWIVPKDACCDSFQNKFGVIKTGGVQ